MPLSGILSAILALVFVVTAAAAPAAAQELAWRHDYAAARKEATETSRPLLLDFGYDGCVWCRKQDATTFRDPALIKSLGERSIPVKVDAQRDERLARALGIERYPTLVLASPEGKILGRHVGYADVSQVTALLAKASVRTEPAAPTASRAEAVRPVDRPKTMGFPVGPTSVEVERARREYDTGRFAESIRLCREVLAGHPSAAEAAEARRLLGLIATDPAALRQVRVQILDGLDVVRPSIAATLDR